MFSKIPEELTKLRQWVCFDITADGQKIPYIPGSENQAASNRPTDWRSFRAALTDVEAGKRHHLGFCFASSDPYVFIDLDDMDDPDQLAVFKKLDTYAQKSVSGTGVHLICKGTFVGAGKHPKKPDAGIFKETRFCLMTGDVIEGRDTIKEIPTDYLQAVHTWLGGGSEKATMPLVEYQSDIADMSVIEMGCDRFDKFSAMCSGKWEQFTEYNHDHSAADHAFIAMLCDLTECNEQVRYLFKISGMWGVDRAEKKAGHGPNGYIDRTIKKIRGKQQEEFEKDRAVQVNFRQRVEVLETPLEISPKEKPRRGSDAWIESMPEGLVKEIARYSWRTSYLPLQEPSGLVGIGVISSIAGRRYLTPTGIGLNTWMILAGKTGSGKDEFQSGLQRVFNSIAKKLPSVANILGGQIMSGPAIQTIFSDIFRFASYVPEMGDFYHTTANPAGQDHQRSLQEALLNSFMSSKVGGALRARKKAQKDEDAKTVERPCLSLFGETTPTKLYPRMTVGDIMSGLLPRFMVFDVRPESISTLPNYGTFGNPLPADLLADLERLAFMCDKADASGEIVRVQSVPAALRLLREFEADSLHDLSKMGDSDPTADMRTRAPIKIYRLASIYGVGADIDTPRIEVEHAEYAIKTVTETTDSLLERFNSGAVGGGQVAQENDLLEVFSSMCRMTTTKRRALGLSPKLAEDKALMTHALLKSRAVVMPSFAGSKDGAVTAFAKCLAALEKSGKIAKLSPTMAADYGVLRGEILAFMER